LKALREKSIKKDAAIQFNTFLQQFKRRVMSSKDKAAFWDFIRNENLFLITNAESQSSSATSGEAIDFLEENEDITLENEEETLEGDADELLSVF